jgi:hypothetical protein
MPMVGRRVLLVIALVWCLPILYDHDTFCREVLDAHGAVAKEQNAQTSVRARHV